ncbi:Flp pilus assembly complex ATPase component TadA [Coriobacteriia bacterium Es71-Z0120]|uniref:GspE/PulE family protein n=1 Tax=Parvivirga hydrogeniphila TaxID=2939460 RepID=UPI00226082A7|nr:ATPase, T2SS/T4P/T4SS family [Parvivirga hydrogeniphila]MCL4078748.1 Flp pilus assembly complex ATPase component TadA [Parvivirga hydrogeniphila]
MIDPASIAGRVLDSLASAGLLTVEQIAALDQTAQSRGETIATVLRESGFVRSSDIASVLEHEMGVPRVDLSSYAPEESALRMVPASVAVSRRILPLFEIEGMLTVAIGEPFDVFLLDDLARELGVEVEPVLAEPDAIVAALQQHYGSAQHAPEPVSAPASETPPPAPVAEQPAVAASDFFEEEAGPVAPVVAAAPAAEPAAKAELSGEAIERMAEGPAAESSIDLDVLAVADARKVAVLVTQIFELAVAQKASQIHLLPYKDDFFLVLRVAGALEKVASAPLSLQGALAEGFRAFVKAPPGPVSGPSLARSAVRIGEHDLAVTLSSVPTVAGQRLVVSLEPRRREPKGLDALGMTDAEVRALHAMVERGRGMLLVCAPVASGASSTYYALLAHAASAGKTVYSVEHAVAYEIPAVAQVMVDASSPVPAANYFAAGLRQDTDVVAIDGIRSVEDVHLAVEAAGMGKLVVATFPAADIASGVRRLLDLGVEPHSLAQALTLGVGQRLVRLNCPNCTQEVPSQALALLPGGTPEIVNKAGLGCPNCNKTGFRGAVGIFEVLPFTEPLRARVAASASADELADAAAAAGMRSLAESGLARVRAGQVSADELARVLRI